MANSQTLNYNLVKPQVGAATDNWGSLLNGNFDTIDTTLKTNEIAASNAVSSASSKLPLAGGTLTGVLTLSETGSDTSPDKQAAAIKYVKDKVAAAQLAAGQGLPLTGGTMSGFITLHADPTSIFHASTKQYTDNIVKNSFTMNNNATITLGGAPTLDLHAATKAYVDSKSATGALILSPAAGVTQTIAGQTFASYPITVASPDNQLATIGYVKANSSAGAAILSTSTAQTFTGGITMSAAGNALNVTNKIVCGTLEASADITLTSDVRIKEDIRQITDALSTVHQMRGVSFVYKNTKKASIGVIAQEVEQVIPSIVHTDEQGLKSVAYANIVGVLIEAVKELSDRVKELEAR